MSESCNAGEAAALLDGLEPKGFFSSAFDFPVLSPCCASVANAHVRGKALRCCWSCRDKTDDAFREVARQLLCSLEACSEREAEVNAHLTLCKENVCPEVEADWLDEQHVARQEKLDLEAFALSFAEFWGRELLGQ